MEVQVHLQVMSGVSFARASDHSLCKVIDPAASCASHSHHSRLNFTFQFNNLHVKWMACLMALHFKPEDIILES